MQKVYEHPAGGIVAELPNGDMDLFLRTEINPGEDDAKEYVSGAPAFNLVGQGTSPVNAGVSLSSVLTNHLDAYARVGRLREAFPAPWQESQKDSAEIAALQARMYQTTLDTLRFIFKQRGRA